MYCFPCVVNIILIAYVALKMDVEQFIIYVDKFIDCHLRKGIIFIINKLQFFHVQQVSQIISQQLI